MNKMNTGTYITRNYYIDKQSYDSFGEKFRDDFEDTICMYKNGNMLVSVFNNIKQIFFKIYNGNDHFDSYGENIRNDLEDLFKNNSVQIRVEYRNDI